MGLNQTRSKQDCLEMIFPSLGSQLIFVKVIIHVHIAEVVLLLHWKLQMKIIVSKYLQSIFNVNIYMGDCPPL